MNDKHRDEILIYKHINSIIDSELQNEEPDMELIDECNALLEDMERGIYDPKPDVKAKRLQELYTEYHKKYTRNRIIRFRVKWSKMATAACVVILLIGIPVTVAAVNGISAIDLIVQFGNKILSWNVGETVESEGVSLIRNDEVINYASIEDCIKQENLDIYCTSWLPDDVYVESAIVMVEGDQETLIINYSDENVSYSCTEGTSGNYNGDDHANEIIINGSTAYYKAINNKYLAEITLDNKVYCISADNYEDMVNILNGLKKVK